MRHRSLIASLATLLAASPLAADDGPVIGYVNSSFYEYKVTLLPDIDQQRTPLPNDGNMYCVPTSILNLCAYAGFHGFHDEVQCDNVLWLYYALDLLFDEVTNKAFSFGVQMNTDPWNGTSGAGGLSGASSVMGGGFFVFRVGPGNGGFPNFDDIAGVALNGGLVAVCCGWYDPTFETSRNGGHCMSVARLFRTNDFRLIGVHDPGSDGNDALDSQSQFTREDYEVVRELRWINGVPALVDRLVGLTSNDRHAIIDSFYAFIPLHAYHYDPATTVVDPQGPPNWNVSQAMTLSAPIFDIADDPFNATLYGIQPSASETTPIVHVNTIAQTETVVAEEIDLIGLAISRSRRVYTLADDNRVTCRRIRGETLPVEVEITLDPDAPLHAIAYDNDADEVLLLAGDQGELHVMPADLSGTPVVHDIGVDLPGTPQMALDPRTGIVWFTSSGSEQIVGYDRGDQSLQWVEHPSIENVTSLSVTPEGNLLLGDGSVSTCLTAASVEVPDCPWAEQSNGGHVYFPRSVTNHTSAMEGPEWNNDLPDTFAPSIPWCRADLDGNDAVDVSDMLALLALWGTDDLLGDMDESGLVDVSDLLQVLAAWGPCP